MERNPFEFDHPIDVAWCPGCGNFKILAFMKEIFQELNLPQEQLVMVSGIGQAAKAPQYIKTNYFNGLHGRALPPATGIKASNPSLTVFVESGDGDMYGEGGNHLIHCVRRNPDIKCLVHNNMVYGLTKGQASPTSDRGQKTPIQIEGVISDPFNPLAVAIALDTSFVARIFCGHKDQSKDILKKAIQHKGFALIDCFQPCVTFNKINNYKWFEDHTYYLEASHDPQNRVQAFTRSIEREKLPLGIFYINEEKPIFEAQLSAYHEEHKDPLFKRTVKAEQLNKLIDALRT